MSLADLHKGTTVPKVKRWMQGQLEALQERRKRLGADHFLSDGLWEEIQEMKKAIDLFDRVLVSTSIGTDRLLTEEECKKTKEIWDK